MHGSKAVVSALYKSLGSIEGLRPAEPGEFTKRAFINGKMDLTEAEAVADLISAQTDKQRDRALNALSGETKALYASWRQRLKKAAAHCEANIDFGEDELLDEELLKKATEELSKIKAEVLDFLNNGTRRNQLITEGVSVVIVGAPNSGKSSLINKLCMPSSILSILR